jgi:hypothetical protein
LADVAGFIPKCNVPLGGVVDGVSLPLAEPKRLTSAGAETLVAADTAGEQNRPTFAWVLLTVKTDPVPESEVAAAGAQLVVFTEEVTAVLPKLNKLFVASVATGFKTLITVLADDELKPPLLVLLSDTDTWLVCSSEEGEVIDPLHIPRYGVEEVTGCEQSPDEILGNELGAFRDELDGESED